MSLDEHGGWSGVLGRLTAGADLSAAECTAVLSEILAGHATDAQKAAFIVGLRLKGETVEELTGLQRAMIAAAEPLNVPDEPSPNATQPLFAQRECQRKERREEEVKRYA